MSERQDKTVSATAIVSALIRDWQDAREALQEIERAEHPDITDHHGRVWVWKSKDIYVHCDMAVTKDMVTDGRGGLPKQSVLDNQNYELCEICLAGRLRYITPCLPEWNCSHAACARIHNSYEPRTS